MVGLRGRRRRFLVAALGVYVLVALSTPVLHHDMACHLKSPTHCEACVANPLASRVETGTGLLPAGLPVAGRVDLVRIPAAPAGVVPCEAGRSPPA